MSNNNILFWIYPFIYAAPEIFGDLYHIYLYT